MRFFDCKTAPSPRRVRIFLAEKGVSLETVEVDLGSGEQFGEAFRTINPDCAVPVLELDDGSHISEVLAICDYLEARHPEPNLMGSDAAERARVLMWNGKVEQLGLIGVMEAFRNFSKGFRDRALSGPDQYAQNPELAERGRVRTQRFLQRLDDELATRPYLAGDRFTMADITALVCVDFAGWIKVLPPDDAEHLQRWYADVSARPSAAV